MFDSKGFPVCPSRALFITRPEFLNPVILLNTNVEY